MSIANNAANSIYEDQPAAIMESLVGEVVGDPAELERSLRDRLTAKLLREKDRSLQKDAASKDRKEPVGHSKRDSRDDRTPERSSERRSKDDRRTSDRRDRDGRRARSRDRKDDRRRSESSRHKTEDDRRDRGRSERRPDRCDKDRDGQKDTSVAPRPFDGSDLKRRRLAVVQSSSKNGAASSESIAKELHDDLEAYVMESDAPQQPPEPPPEPPPPKQPSEPPPPEPPPLLKPAPSSGGALKARFSIGITSSSLERIMGHQGPPTAPGDPTGAIQKVSPSSLVKNSAAPSPNLVSAAPPLPPFVTVSESVPVPAANKRSSHSASKVSSSRPKAESPRPRSRRSPRRPSSRDRGGSSSRRREAPRRSRRRSRSRSSSRSSSRGHRRSPPRRRQERSRSRGRRDEKPRGRRSSPPTMRESRLGIDKKKLRRIAIMNVLRSMRIRVTNADSLNAEQLGRFKASGISAEEIKEICQRLVSKKEKLRAAGADDATIEAATLTEEEDVGDPGPGLEGGKPLKIKDRFLVGARAPDVQPLLGATPADSVAAPTALREMFPVSSGILHRTNGTDPNEPAKPAEPEQPSTLVQDPTLGQYTGKAEVKLLSQKDLEGGFQTWVRKNQFMSARPVQSSIGEQLLRRMGWNFGEGLGKNKDGTTQPIQLDIKVDRKGLASLDEKVSTKKSLPTSQEMKFKNSAIGQSGKHPVSVLMEQSNKRRWSAPVFSLVAENGPSHAKTFVMSVNVNGVTVVSEAGCRTKKDAKTAAAAAALRQLGLS